MTVIDTGIIMIFEGRYGQMSESDNMVPLRNNVTEVIRVCETMYRSLKSKGYQ